MPGAVVDVHPEAHHHAMSAGQAKDEDRLADLGYTQGESARARRSALRRTPGHALTLGDSVELKRGWSMIQSFGISFSIISVITGVTTLFSCE